MNINVYKNSGSSSRKSSGRSSRKSSIRNISDDNSKNNDSNSSSSANSVSRGGVTETVILTVAVAEILVSVAVTDIW